MPCLKIPIPHYISWNNPLGMNMPYIICCWSGAFSVVSRFFQSLQIIYDDVFFKINGTKVESYAPISRPFILIPNYCNWLLLIEHTIVCDCCIRKPFTVFHQYASYFLFGWENYIFSLIFIFFKNC